ncbi:MAG: squalene--hopene cyclase [Phycisphaerales bacterium]|nr:squalene--hopene cyclase [Phycisphaerales bacterium]
MTTLASLQAETRPQQRPSDAALDAAKLAVERAAAALLSLQKPDGHWCAELEGDSILNSEYTLMKWILRQEDDPRLPKIMTYLRRLQRSDGAWGQYPGSGVDVSATVKAYVCLLLDGDSPSEPHMQRAAEAIRSHGGAEACNSFSNFYLAALGLIDWDAVPAIPPEMIYLPRWFYFHLDKVSAWTRTMILPLAICTALRPVRALSAQISIDHLFNDIRFKKTLSKKFDSFPFTWNNFFLAVDRVLKIIQRADASPLRRSALRKAEKWILDRADARHTAGLGAIFPPMVYLQIAFDALGYERSHPVMQQAERDLDDFIIEEEDHIRIQPCFSPVWDTGIALYALTECGRTISNSPEVSRACEWLLAKENRLAGDWPRTVDAAPAGWFFEYHNEWYPDVDDTAMVAMALHRAGGQANRAAGQRGVQWIFAMQNDDGGWAAFDKTRDRPILEKVPFADHNAMQDPSCPDITGRVLECLAWHGIRADHPAVQRAVKYIRSKQEPEGCWFGRWGVNYIYGTWQSIGGMRHIGVDMNQPWIQRAGHWLKSVQKSDGSFGESANSYEDPSLKGIGPSTASQTAWAAMTLQVVFGPHDPDLARAIRWLCDTQLSAGDAPDRSLNPDGDPPGSWVETEFTGTGFPRVFYLRYHLYRLYFPLMAIARWVHAQG